MATGRSSRISGSTVSATWPSRPQRRAIGGTPRDGRRKRSCWFRKRVSTRSPRARSPTPQERWHTSNTATTQSAARQLEHVRRLRPLLHGVTWLDADLALRCAEISLDLGDLAGALEFKLAANDALQGYPDAGTLPARLQGLRERISRGKHFELTPAELRLISFLPTHLSLQEIADRVHVSRPTVKTQVASIYDKLGVKTRSEAVEIIDQYDLGATDRRLSGPDPTTG